MPNLFGLNIGKIVDDSIRSAGGVRSGNLTRSTPGTRSTTNPSAGTQPTTQTFPFRGFVENGTEMFRDGTVTRMGGEFLSILGNSINTIPKANDVAVMDGVTYKILAIVKTDPAQALFVCAVES